MHTVLNLVVFLIYGKPTTCTYPYTIILYYSISGLLKVPVGVYYKFEKYLRGTNFVPEDFIEILFQGKL